MRTGGLGAGLWATLFVVGFALTGGAAAQAPDAAAAQEAFSQGLAAASAQQYPLALEYFTTAQKADPNRSDIWFNLGLASSKIPGHEFRALGFFQAYLLDVPDSPKRPAIEQLMKQLGIPIEAKLLALLDELRAMMPGAYDWEQEALAGHRDRAIQALQASETASQHSMIYGYNTLARAFARNGDVADALIYLGQYEAYVDKGFSDPSQGLPSGDIYIVYRDMIGAYARRKDLKSAAVIYERMRKRSAYVRNSVGAIIATNAVGWFACMQQQAGDRAAAAATLRQWLTVIAVPPVDPEHSSMSGAIEALAAAQHLSGDPQAAANTLKLIKSRYDFHDMTAPMFPPTFNPSPLSSTDIDSRESIDCWTPEHHKQKFLALGLRGFQIGEAGVSELNIETALADIKKSDKNSIMTRFEILIEIMAEAYNEVKLRGKG